MNKIENNFVEIGSLNIDVLGCVLSLLPYFDKIKCQRVSKLWKQVLSEPRILFYGAKGFYQSQPCYLHQSYPEDFSNYSISILFQDIMPEILIYCLIPYFNNFERRSNFICFEELRPIEKIPFTDDFLKSKGISKLEDEILSQMYLSEFGASPRWTAYDAPPTWSQSIYKSLKEFEDKSFEWAFKNRPRKNKKGTKQDLEKEIKKENQQSNFYQIKYHELGLFLSNISIQGKFEHLPKTETYSNFFHQRIWEIFSCSSLSKELFQSCCQFLLTIYYQLKLDIGLPLILPLTEIEEILQKNESLFNRQDEKEKIELKKDFVEFSKDQVRAHLYFFTQNKFTASTGSNQRIYQSDFVLNKEHFIILEADLLISYEDVGLCYS